MKTTAKTLSKIFGTMILVCTTLILNPVQAGNAGNIHPDTTSQALASTHASLTSDMTDPPTSRLSNEMLQDPFYWVNYLNSTIDPNEDELSSRMNVIDEMQNDPDYWVDFLKQIVTGE